MENMENLLDAQIFPDADTHRKSNRNEEFIEGIKPIIDENKQDIGYTIEPGVFKEFCENARSIVRTKNGDSIDAGARIWKLTIMNGDLNQVKQECFEENNVRMGFDIDSDEARSFVEDVKLGDIILSFKTRKTIDGIAIVTDEAAELQDKSMYKTARAVKWLAKNIDEDITDINNGKLLHRMTFAKVPNMNVKDVIKLAEKVNPGLESTVIEENTEPHVFIIDEINRGNISKIFGELITLIESTKRAGMSESASAILPYSGDEFSVPSNVYILGTMNTADRSIALMDTALRRRFQFIEMMPDSDVLRKIHADKVEDLDVAAMLDKINERITFLYDREHTIGHAFFTGLKDDASLSKLQSIFEKSVIPLLQEYFYEDYQKIQLVLGDNAKSDDSLKFILDEKVVAKQVNNVQIMTYYSLGRWIVEVQQQGKHRAEYGKKIIINLSKKLTEEFGKGFSESTLEKARKFYLTYKDRISETLFTEFAIKKSETVFTIFEEEHPFVVTWSHYLQLMRIENEDERSFYEIEAAREKWGVRDLSRQYNSSLYERLALSMDKDKVQRLSQEGNVITTSKDVLKDPYVLEFVGLEDKYNYSETDLENRLLDNLQQFLLELGKGFTFVARQKRFSFEEDHFRVDLVFYNRLLKCFVLFDLKIGKLKHQDLGQMQMYVNYYDRYEKTEEENPTIGVLLCNEKNDAMVELTLPEDSNIYASQYKLYLPDKKLLQDKLKEWLQEEGGAEDEI